MHEGSAFPANKTRLAEVIGSLALATDLAIGLPLEHGLRRTLIALWLAEELGLGEQQLSDVYYVALLGSVACVLNEAAYADCLRDEIEFRSRMFVTDMNRLPTAISFFVRNVAIGDPPWRRVRKMLSLAAGSGRVSRDIAVQCGDMLNLGPAIREALGQCDEHWNGKYAVLGLKGEEISLPARLFLFAQDVDVYYRVGGVDRAMAVARERASTFYDPKLSERFCQVAPALLGRLETSSAWDAVMEAEPGPPRDLSPEELRHVLRQIADFIDMRSHFTIGHSAGVAALAEGAGRALGLSPRDVSNLYNAGLIHDLGRAGVPVTWWHKTGALETNEWDRMRQHASLTEVVLARSPALGALGTVAAVHHERLDGSGYRGVSAASLPMTARVLAAADTYQTKIEARPHRAALSRDAAADHLRREAVAGRLDGEAVDAVLRGIGAPRRGGTRASLPAGLSEREAEVLALAVRGLTNREMAEALVVSPKTIGHHIESIYRKIGVSTRAGATIFAVRNGLAGNPD
jgi:HD-GYP domain-containing protein (c-di-GMP phosphodiesterase class II)/DNA-binding CsgD family transcriptional regulator